MVALQEITYSERCEDCGAIFTVDSLVPETDSFRIHISVENTGRYGDLKLYLDGTRVFLLDTAQAATFVAAYPELWARREIPYQQAVELKAEAYSLHRSETAVWPVLLKQGERWDGWLGTVTRPCPPDAVGFLGYIGPIWQEQRRRWMTHATHDRVRPFIGLRGDVTVTPLSGLALLRVRASSYLRRFVGLEAAAGLVGSILGTAGVASIASGWDRAFAIAAVVGGAWSGYYAGWYFAAYFKQRLSRAVRSSSLRS